MVEPVTTVAIGVTAAVTWAADRACELAWAVTGNELHVQLRERLPSTYARFTRDKLPPNHELAHAAKEALQRALLSFAAGLRATTDPTPTLYAKAVAWLRRGPRFESHAAAWQRDEEAGWLKVFRQLTDDDERLAELELITAKTARELLQTAVHEPARELLHRSVQTWAERHRAAVPGWPAAWLRCLQEGWRVSADDDQRITLYQALALHFREAVKHRPEYLAELEADRLQALARAAKGDAELDVRVVLEFSLCQLAADEQAALHALCVMPADFHRTIGAAVVGGDADLLDALAEAGVQEADSDRYALHDLMRDVATGSATPEALYAAHA